MMFVNHLHVGPNIGVHQTHPKDYGSNMGVVGVMPHQITRMLALSDIIWQKRIKQQTDCHFWTTNQHSH